MVAVSASQTVPSEGQAMRTGCPFSMRHAVVPDPQLALDQRVSSAWRTVHDSERTEADITGAHLLLVRPASEQQER